jgi:hypothetical protein
LPSLPLTETQVNPKEDNDDNDDETQFAHNSVINQRITPSNGYGKEPSCCSIFIPFF